MSTDFAGAHERHHRDAEFLEDAHRLSNADHLYGFAAECGLKALMTRFGMPVDADGDPQNSKKERVHIDRLWGRYPVYLTHPAATGYQLDSANHFADWRSGDRYADDQYVTPARLERHRDGAEKVRALVQQARVEGLLP